MKWILWTLPLVILGTGCSPSGPMGMNWGDSTSGASNFSQSLANGYQSTALAILQANCTSCHTATAGPLNVYALTDVNHLVSSGLVVPGSPSTSPLFTAISSGSMPPGSPLSSADQMTISDWIAGGSIATPTTGPGSTTTTLPGTTLPTYASLSATVFIPKCATCHSASSAAGGYAFDSLTGVMAAVNLSAPSSSPVYTATHGGVMPPSPNPVLNSQQEQALLAWITAGAPQGAGTTTTTLPPSDHVFSANPTFTELNTYIFMPKCSGCHSSYGSYPGINNLVNPGNASGSTLFQITSSGSMPQGGPALSAAAETAIKTWINNGAINN